jgi:hypothetical protein
MLLERAVRGVNDLVTVHCFELAIWTWPDDRDGLRHFRGRYTE